MKLGTNMTLSDDVQRLRLVNLLSFFVVPASGMAQYRDPVFHQFLHWFFNIFDDCCIDLTVWVCFSSTMTVENCKPYISLTHGLSLAQRSLWQNSIVIN